MIDAAFCELLEYKINSALQNSTDETTRGYWCDGIVLPAFGHEYSQKYVNDYRQITLAAFIGVDGQGQYSVTLLFGAKALSRYARGLDIAGCIPDFQDPVWFKIDSSKKQAWVQLL